jgi:DNA modification methylase
VSEAKQSIEQRSISSLKPYTKNARTHSAAGVAQIAASIREFGFTSPILISPSGEIRAGHGRVEAARALGMADVPTLVVGADWTAAQVRAYILADNKLAANAGWDDALLAVELGELQAMDFDLALTGFSADEIGELLADKTAGLTDPDDAPEPPAEPVSALGDVWIMGGHRLACGDSTDAATVERLMAGKRASLLFTSPPYGNQRDYTIGGIADWDALMRGVFSCLADVMAEEGQVIVNLGLVHRDNEWLAYWDAWLDWMRAQGWRRFGLYVWDQGPGLPGDWAGRLAPSFEFLFHFNRVARKPNKNVQCKFAGVDTHKRGRGGLRAKDGDVAGWGHAGKVTQATRISDNVIRVTRHKGNGNGHPAVFPVALPEFVMNAFSNEGGVVFEPFAGSFTTGIAAEMTGRKCYAIELAPAYVDVAVTRWQNFTGKTAILESTGETFAEVTASRGRPPKTTPAKPSAGSATPSTRKSPRSKATAGS